MFEIAIAFLGYPTGLLLAYLCKEELKSGERYFKNLILILIFIIIILFFINQEKNYLFLSFGLIIGIILSREYLYFGLLKHNFYINLIIFTYGLFYGTLKYKKEKEILVDSLLFFIPIIILYYFPIELTSAGSGGLIGVIIKKGLNLFSKQ